jgi:replication protein
VTVSHKLGGKKLKDYYKLDKFLFEDQKYRNLKLNSKISYCILKNMLNENINVQVDEEENKYLENTRSYLMQKLNITKNTITSIYKELIRVNLIEEKWITVGKSNIVCIKNLESKEQEQNHNICEKKEEEIEKIITVKEISSLDVILANEFINKIELKTFDFEYKKIEKVILWNHYTSNEKDFIRIALKFITRKKGRKNLDNIIKHINNDTIQEALLKLKQSERKCDVFKNL